MPSTTSVRPREPLEARFGRWHEAPSACAQGLRIALFSGNYNGVRDGANRALNRLVAHLLARGAAVRVYSPTAGQAGFEAPGDIVSIPSVGIPGRSEYRLSVGFPATIREDILRFAPTHFHISCPDYAGGRAQSFARSLGLPVVASMHTRFETYPAYYGLDFITPAIKRRLRNFYSRSDYVLAPNRPMADSLRDLGVSDERVRIWGRGVEHGQFTASRRSEDWRRSLGYAKGEPILLFFGRLVQEKGLDMFVATVRALQARGHVIRPLIVGEGPARPWLEKELAEAVFTGHLDGEALGRAVASADILLNPSITEAFGNVNLEAMAAGLAIVSADVGSASALIENGRSGVLVPAKDAKAYADAVEGLIRSPMRRRGLGLAAAAASASYHWPDILDDVIAVYRSAQA